MARLFINNKSYLIDEEPDTPLLWVLRENLQLTGTKFGCGGGHCGACTVHINGEAVRSCQIRVDDVEGAVITTIEGLSTSGDHPVQQAWLEHRVPQCGYCQSGQIMQAVSLLRNNPDPSDKEIERSMRGNMCRCMTYGRVNAAIKSVAKNKNNNSI
jgi:aerobic-type carbon monoxide dehydrogenase small subunit (CoxS/CutS family)